MILTTESLTKFKEGQMEIQGLDKASGYALRGQVGDIIVEKEIIYVHFIWLANGEGYPPSVIRWTNNCNLDYNTNQKDYVIKYAARERLVMHSLGENKLAILFLPDDDLKLNPIRVKGLKLNQ